MRPLLAFVFAAFLPVTLAAQQVPDSPTPALIQPADERDLSEFLWKNRVVLVFADSDADPRYQDQLDKLARGAAELADRDVMVLTDADPGARTPARQKLRPRGFSLVVIDKDGGVKLRKPAPWSVREITRSIDKFPSRLREVEERREDS